MHRLAALHMKFTVRIMEMDSSIKMHRANSWEIMKKGQNAFQKYRCHKNVRQASKHHLPDCLCLTRLRAMAGALLERTAADSTSYALK